MHIRQVMSGYVTLLAGPRFSVSCSVLERVWLSLLSYLPYFLRL